MTALGRRIRRNYLWILVIQSLAYLGKITVHPTPAVSFEQLLDRAAVGPAPGWTVLAAGASYMALWVGIAIWSKVSDRRKFRARAVMDSMG